MAAEKEAQLRLTRAQMEADEIKKEGQRQARYVLEQGRSQFWQEAKKEKENLQRNLDAFKTQLISNYEQEIRQLSLIYQKKKQDLLKEFALLLYKSLEKI